MPAPLLSLLLLADPALALESLGFPVAQRAVALETLTHEGPRAVAWGQVKGDAVRGLVGIGVPDGETRVVNVRALGNSNLALAQAPAGWLALYCGIPGRFVKVDPRSGAYTELGLPQRNATYWTTSLVTASGQLVVGTYPGTNLVTCNLRSGTVADWGRLSDDRRECYVLSLAESAAGVVYAGVGLHHRELWAYDPASGQKTQILPPELAPEQGSPTVWTAADGSVYGRSGTAEFRCSPTGVTLGQTAPPRPRPPLLAPDGRRVGGVNEAGELLLTAADGSVAKLPTQWRGEPLSLYSVGPVAGGRLWGSGIKPGRLFSYDLASGQTVDHGVVTSGSIQVYDGVATAHGLFLGSYVGASLDLLDPSQPIVAGRNPRRLAQLSREFMQERPVQLCEGPDGRIYVACFPVKGHLGGALGRIDPATGKVACWRQVVPEQSLNSLAPVPERQAVLCASSVGGGSSAVPTASEALLALWDCAAERVVATVQPLPGTRVYQAVVRARNGLLYAFGPTTWAALAPADLAVVARGELPGKTLRWPGLHDAPVGPRGLLIGLIDDAVWALDPATQQVRVLGRHPKLSTAHGFWVTAQGTLYVGSGGELLRGALPVE
ncbi:MAG: hypothetical protein IT204_01205 [Fimbriimonadaceae bacterium]|nr:hypothetical protein [Fimbriimonadaceae bacterium]